MISEFEHSLDDSTRDGVTHDISQGSQADNDFMDIIAVEIFEDRRNKHNEKLRILCKKQGAHKIPDSLKN